MSVLTQVQALAADLAAYLPTAVVARAFKNSEQHVEADLDKGIYTLIAVTERFNSELQRDQLSGALRLVLTYQARLSEASDGQAVEDRELAVVATIKAWLAALPAGLCGVDLLSWEGSAQLDTPYCGLIFELELADFN